MPGQNKIVVDYDFESLLCLGMIDHQTGKELSRSEIEQWCATNDFLIVSKFSKTLSECIEDDRKNAEGVVLTYPSTGLKIKIKIPDYVRLHKILTGLSLKSVWELLRDGQHRTIEDWIADPTMPETFKVWVSGVRDDLYRQYSEINTCALNIFESKPVLDLFMPYKESRKILAAYFTKEENRQYSSLLFSILDGKSIDQSIWRMIEPKGNAVFKKEGE